MGTFINKGNDDFIGILEGGFVDKTGMIAVINKTLNTERRYSCVTRSRRFGKTIAANTLCAYYDKSCDSRSLFEDLEIAQPDEVEEKDGKLVKKTDRQFEKYLNKYPVIYLDVTDFTTKYRRDANLSTHIQEDIIAELLSTYDGIERLPNDDLMDVLVKIAEKTHEKFIMIIDEWDAICRELENDEKAMDNYVDLLRRLFKGSNSKKVFAGVYMTGILPIKRYNTESALNNFREYSVIKPGALAKYFGFVPSEVESIAKQSDLSIDELKAWYDGYQIGSEPSVFNPWSVMEAVAEGECGSYWTATGAYDSVANYINLNYAGLKDDIIGMLAGERCDVVTTGFENDLSKVKSKDDVLTILIHLGYLSYDKKSGQCYIPNREVREAMEGAIKACKWEHVIESLNASKHLLADTLDMNEEAVAHGIELTHDEETSILSYNDENSLACVLSIAYYYAKNDYIMHRELASGKGFADIVFIPRRNVDSPALIIELKCDKDADAAIDQIRRKEYPAKVAEYTGDILLVGINYDKKSKLHTCKIENYAK